MGYQDGLGKYPRMLAVGDPLTREQTNEVMMRTNDWSHVFCNDEEWEVQVASILGWFDRFDELVEAGECEDSYAGWCREKYRVTPEYGERIGSLGLAYVDNTAIMHANVDGPQRWLEWDGTINADWTIGVKYPEIEEITDEWVRVAKAFPFLRMHVQALSCGWGAEGAAPADTVVVEWFIRDGQVHLVRLPWELPRRVYKPTRPLRRKLLPVGVPDMSGPWFKVKHSKPMKPLRSVYWKWWRWRHDAHLNFEFFPRPFDWGMASFEERAVSAARLIEAAEQIERRRRVLSLRSGARFPVRVHPLPPGRAPGQIPALALRP